MVWPGRAGRSPCARIRATAATPKNRFVAAALRSDLGCLYMPTKLRPRTVLQVSKNTEGDIEIALVTETVPDETRSMIVVRPEDVPILIDMLRGQLGEGDPDDLSTLRNLRPVT